jgi:hypothetical protein
VFHPQTRTVDWLREIVKYLGRMSGPFSAGNRRPGYRYFARVSGSKAAFKLSWHRA